MYTVIIIVKLTVPVVSLGSVILTVGVVSRKIESFNGNVLLPYVYFYMWLHNCVPVGCVVLTVGAPVVVIFGAVVSRRIIISSHHYNIATVLMTVNCISWFCCPNNRCSF